MTLLNRSCGNVVKCEHIRGEDNISCQRSLWMLPWPINWMTFPFGQVHFINSTANHYSHISIFLHKSFSRSEKNETICKHKLKEVHLWYEIKEQSGIHFFKCTITETKSWNIHIFAGSPGRKLLISWII